MPTYQSNSERICMRAKLLELCLTLCDTVDHSLLSFSVCGILQTRILEWSCCTLLQGIFPNQQSNLPLLGILHWQAGFLPPAPGKPRKNLLAIIFLYSLLFAVSISEHVPVNTLFFSFWFKN